MSRDIEAVKRVLANAAARAMEPSPLLLVTAARGDMDEELKDLR